MTAAPVTLATLRAAVPPDVLVRDFYVPDGHYGFSFALDPARHAGHRAAILINRAVPAHEQLFTLAHELGHVVRHIGQPGACPGEQAEKEADAFAAALLAGERAPRPPAPAVRTVRPRRTLLTRSAGSDTLEGQSRHTNGAGPVDSRSGA